ncbi:MAG: NAD(P)/FAD-dependent oxidoreductase [Bacteroidales bacterium]
MDGKFDVIIIGGGPGGTPAAIQLASAGKKVLLAEESGKLGGACLFVGCIPSKIIKHGADAFSNSAQGHRYDAVSKEVLAATWQSIRRDIDRILNGRSSEAAQQINRMPITFMTGKVRFISNNEVEISNNRYRFDKAIIAPGSHSFIPPVRGNGVQEVLTSEVLFRLPALPSSMLIIGGGPIGIEIAQMLTKLHVKCPIVEMMPSVLSGVVEPEFARGITQKLQESGIDVNTSSTVQEINKINGAFRTEFTDAEGKTRIILAEKVLVVTGKVPSIEDLNLEATDVHFDRHGISVNEFLETSVPGIYATGDVVVGAPKFAHTATYEAHIAATNILRGNISRVSFTKNVWVLFSDPEIAAAGLTETEAVKAGYDVMTGVYNYQVEAASQISGDTFGFLKFVVNRQNQVILGVHLFINGASSLSGEASLIVANKLTLTDVASTIHPHPTLTEAFSTLATKMLAEHQVTEPPVVMKTNAGIE